jgi:transposase
VPIKDDKRRYRSRSRIDFMFDRLRDWRRVATRYDRRSTVFFSAIALAATVIFCSDQRVLMRMRSGSI